MYKKILGVILTNLICVAAAYFFSSYLGGAVSAKLSGNMPYSHWQEKFLILVLLAGGITCLCSIIWVIFSNSLFTVNSGGQNNRRIFWIIPALITLAGNIAVTQFVSKIQGIYVDISITGVFLAIFLLIGYWIVSIVVTPPAFGHVPIGLTGLAFCIVVTISLLIGFWIFNTFIAPLSFSFKLN